MQTEKLPLTYDPEGIEWKNLSFLVAVHVLGIGGIVYLGAIHFSWATIAFTGLFYLARALAITAGYHRRYTHKAYDCAPIIEWLYLFFGAASFQNSVIAWASDHRNHHAHGDGELDPYRIDKGFWYAHIGWVLRKGLPRDFRNVQDLSMDRRVAFQHRWYAPLGILVGAVLPLFAGFLWDDPLGALLVGSALGLTIQYHSTFAVNSFAHMIGTKPDLKETSARNSWLVAIITFGEGGNHNTHHAYPARYYTGPQWWNFDPPKWFIKALSGIGLAWNLQGAR